DRGYAPTPRRSSFRRSEKPSLPFIQLRQYRCIARAEFLERIFINHPQSYDAPPPQGIPAASLSGHNRFSYSLTNPNITIGTIFSVLDAPAGELGAAQFLQPG